jgi:hypothetical protein
MTVHYSTRSVDEWTNRHDKVKATFCNFANMPRLSGTMNCYECPANNKNFLSLLGIY